MNVVIPPLSLSGPCLTVRRFRREGFSLRDLVAGGTLPAELAEFLALCVAARASVLVSGGTGSGKTTTLNALSGAIPGEERIVTIEDAAELRLRQRHVVRLEARPANLEGRGEVTIRQLVRNALRMRPDRIVVGEVRGAEALDMLQALNTGHDGSLTTVHANSPADALRRVETLALMAGVGLPHAAVREQVGERARPGRAPGAPAGRRARGRVGHRGGAGGRRRGHARALPPRAASCAARDRVRSRAGWRRSAGGRTDAERRARCSPSSPRAAGLGACVQLGARLPARARRARAAARPWRGRGSSTCSCGSAARAALRARPSGAGCCWPGRSRRSWPARRSRARCPGLLLAAAGPWAVARVLRARRGRYRRAVDAGVARMALALADALGGGHSLRGALAEAARGVDGAAGHELRRAAGELAAGATTDEALEAMRARVPSARLDTLVAACLLQRRAGGDLARLLRESARAMEDQGRLEDEVRAATAQARFTGLIVVLLPLGGGLLAELASPGWFAGLWSSFLTAWLVGIAVVLQVAAAVLMRRLARVRW